MREGDVSDGKSVLSVVSRGYIEILLDEFEEGLSSNICNMGMIIKRLEEK